MPTVRPSSLPTCTPRPASRASAIMTFSRLGATYDPSVEVWTNDGTASGTHRLGASLELRSQQPIGYGSVVADDGFVYFAGLQFTSNIVYSIWRTDGTDAGTSIFTQAPGAPLLLPIFIVRYQGKIFFSYSCDTVSYSGADCLWRPTPYRDFHDFRCRVGCYRKSLEEVDGGPCRDRTYDQLIKRRPK